MRIIIICKKWRAGQIIMADTLTRRADLLEPSGRNPRTHLQDRIAHAPRQELALRRRRRRIATGILCTLGIAAFLGLYALSWVLVLNLP